MGPLSEEVPFPGTSGPTIESQRFCLVQKVERKFIKSHSLRAKSEVSFPKPTLLIWEVGKSKQGCTTEHLVGRSRAAGPGAQGIVPNPATLSAALQEDLRKSRLQCRSRLESVPHIRLLPWDYSSVEAETLDPAAMGTWEEMKKCHLYCFSLLTSSTFPPITNSLDQKVLSGSYHKHERGW